MKIKTSIISILVYLSFASIGVAKSTSISNDQVHIPKVIVLTTVTAPTEGDEDADLVQVSQFAIDEYDKVNGTKTNIKLISVDDRADPQHAREELEKVIPKEKPIAIIGPIYSNVAMGIKEYISQEKIPLVSIFATHNDFTKDTKYFFRMCASNRRLINSMADFLVPLAQKNHLNIQTFKDLTDDYSIDLADTFRSNINGTKVSESEILFKGVPGVTRLLDLDSKIWNPKKSDILFLATRDTVAGHIIAALESEPYLVATIDPVNFILKAKQINKDKTHIRYVYTSQWLPGKSAYSRKIEASFQKHFGHPMNITEALTFDTAFTVAAAYAKSQEKGVAMVEAIPLVHFKGVTGDVLIEASGERTFSDQFFKEGFIE